MSLYRSDIKPFSIRKQIFSEYRLPDDPIKIERRTQISKDKKSSNQVLLRQLGLFKFNVSSVLSQKNDLIKKLQRFNENIRKVYRFIAEYNESDTIKSDEIERKFKGIQEVRNQSEIMQNARSTIRKSKKEAENSDESQYLLKALIIYKGLLNFGQSLKFEAESFRLGTLSNFNPKYTQVRFTKGPIQSENTVMRYVMKIIEQSSKAMQSKVRYENNYQKDRFLLQQDKYVNCWKSLQEMYSPKQVQLINFEMLNILDSFDKEFNKFKQTLGSHNENYKRYQGVMDSMDLMRRQSQQMTHTTQSRDEIISNFVSLSQQDPCQMQRVLLKCEQQQKLIQKNIKIYHINEKLFASYNTQTNLKSYSKQRNHYSIKLNQLENRLANWNIEYATVKQIVDSYNNADDIINKRIINPKRIGLTKSSSDLDNIILKIQQINTRKSKHLNSLKNNLLQNLKQKTYKSNTKNTQSSFRRVSESEESSIDDQIVQKQKSLLITLQRTIQCQKKSLLVENHQKIKQYMEYNRRKRQDSKLTASTKDKLKILQGKFSLLDEIAKTYKQIKQMQVFLELDEELSTKTFEKIIKQHLGAMQKQINFYFKQNNMQKDEFVYRHIYDYSLFENLFQSEVWFQMTSILQKVKGSFISRPVSFSSSSNLQALKQLISFTKAFIKEKYSQLTVNMLEIFSQTLLKLNDGLSSQLYHFEDFYWEKLTSVVTTFYERSNYEFEQNSTKDKTIDKSSFFSLPYLIHLNRTFHKNKVLNLDEILTKIVKMMYDQFSNFRQHEIFQSAVCLTYLMKYIRNVCSRDQVQIKIMILSKLRRLLTSHLLKAQFMKIYEIEQKNHKEINQKMIKTAFGLQEYLSFKVIAQKRDKITSFQSVNIEYLKGIDQQVKVLVINLSGPYSTQFNLKKVKLFWSFQEWIITLIQLLSQSDSIRKISINSYLLIQRNQFESLLKLVQTIDWNSIKQSDGFLIRMIRKENFYLKRQFNKFKTLQKQNVWKEFGQILDRLIQQISVQNSLRKGFKEESIKKLNQIELKMNKTLAILNKKHI